MPLTFSLAAERLRLRAVAGADVEELVRLHDNPLVAEYLGPGDREWHEWRIEASLAEWAERGHGFGVALDAAAGRFIGRTGFKHWSEFGASVGVAERLGMKPGRRDELDGDPVVVYSIDRPAWERRKA